MKDRPSTFVRLCALLAALPLASTFADVITVDDDGKANFSSIQEAIDAANHGDVILIAAGTYLPANTLDTHGKAITLRGAVDGEDNSLTVIDGKHFHRVLQCISGEGATTVFENLVIRNGFSSSNGGGMYFLSSSPTLTNCRFENNEAAYSGGGVYREGAYWSPAMDWMTFTNCTFTGNSAEYSGGGVYCKGVKFSTPIDSAIFTNCTFTGNSAAGEIVFDPTDPPVSVGEREGGGGVCLSLCFYRSQPVDGSTLPTLTNCTFENNSAPCGGGLFLDQTGDAAIEDANHPLVTNCTFTDNSAANDGSDGGGGGGGGINICSTLPTLTNCTFTGNSATGPLNNGGGGIRTWFINGTVDYSAVIQLEGCDFTANIAYEGSSGGGIYFDGSNHGQSPTLTNCTFSDNSAEDGYGGGMYNLNNTTTLANCTFTDNAADVGGGGMYNSYSSPTVTGCTFTGNSANSGGGMYNFDHSSPMLTDSTFMENSADVDGGGIYSDQSSRPTLTNTTVCSNTPNQIYGNWTDDGDNTVPNEECPGDLNRNGMVDGGDLGGLLGDWNDEGACLQSDLNGDGKVDGGDLGLFLSYWGACP